jgi:hypothetical protein
MRCGPDSVSRIIADARDAQIDYTETDRTYASPYPRLVSDPAKLLSLGWKPECTFSGLAAIMMAEAARRCEVSEPKAEGPRLLF